MLPSNVAIYVATTPVDLRAGFDRLSGLVGERWDADARDGALYIFRNQRGTMLKVLFADRARGYARRDFRERAPDSARGDRAAAASGKGPIGGEEPSTQKDARCALIVLTTSIPIQYGIGRCRRMSPTRSSSSCPPVCSKSCASRSQSSVARSTCCVAN